MAVGQSKQRGIRKTIVSTKLSDDLLRQVDAYAERAGTTRSAAVAALLGVALDGGGEVEGLLRENASLRERLGAARDVLR